MKSCLTNPLFNVKNKVMIIVAILANPQIDDIDDKTFACLVIREKYNEKQTPNMSIL